MSPYIVLFTCGMYSMSDRPSFNVDFPIFFCRNFYVWGAVCALVNVAVSCFPCLIVWGESGIRVHQSQQMWLLCTVPA